VNKEFGSQVLPSTMEDISARHIVRHGERIETFMDNNTFRIVATRAKCEAVVEDIEQALGSIQRREVNLRNLRSDCKYPEFNSWVEKNFDDSTINQLGGLTRTDIKVSHKKRVCIYSCLVMSSANNIGVHRWRGRKLEKFKPENGCCSPTASNFWRLFRKSKELAWMQRTK